MKQFLFCCLFISATALYAQNIGIGTTTPNPSSILDINSANKGVLFPRVNDTGTVNSPMEGLIIYNKHTKSPYYFNGSQWLSLGSRMPSGMSTTTDRITYQITQTGFSTAELEIFSSAVGSILPLTISQGGTTAGNPQLSNFSISKLTDLHSQQLNLANLVATKMTSVEFKYYASGATVPYISYRLKDVYVTSYQVSGSMGGEVFESISFDYKIYGFRDWVNNKSFGYDRSNNTVVAY